MQGQTSIVPARQGSLPFESRPRNRIALAGVDKLSDVELIALVGGRGLPPADALLLGQRVLLALGSVRNLRDAGVAELTRIPGIGPAGASALVAACELGRRTTRTMGPRARISCAADVAAVCGEEMAAYDREHFRVMALDTKNRLIVSEDISVGSLSASLVHPRELYKSAIRQSAAGVVVVHNHPSGDVTPSLADIELTRRLAKAGDVLGIDLLDHVIVGDGRWASLKELNYL
jgi:DNA repair protein RadC